MSGPTMSIADGWLSIASQWVRTARGYDAQSRKVTAVAGAYAGLAVVASSHFAWLCAATFALAWLLDREGEA